jgi:hypothetical protein
MLDLLLDSESFVNAMSSHLPTYTMLWLLHKGLCEAAHCLSNPPAPNISHDSHIERFVRGIELYSVTLLHVSPGSYSNHIYPAAVRYAGPVLMARTKR